MKEAVFPFNKFPGVDPILGPEMKSTGEVMGTGDSLEVLLRRLFSCRRFFTHEWWPGFLSVKDIDKRELPELGKRLVDLGFSLVATGGTQKILESAGLECEKINKVGEGRPDVSDLLKNEQIDLVINTTEGGNR